MNLNINFAMTFPPQKSIIIGLLRIADGINEYSLSEISSCTGIPDGKSTGKVKPSIDYAVSMGLLNAETKNGLYILKRTPLAEIIVLEDFGLTEDITLQVLNYFLSSNSIGCIPWNLIVRNAIILQGDTVDNCALSDKLEREFGKDKKQQKRVTTPFRSAHKDFFQSINFVSEDGDNKIKINRLPVNKRFIFMYAYSLLFDWEKLLINKNEHTEKSHNEIGFDDIIFKIQWGAGFHWDEKTVFEVLELMAEKNIIKLNKQLVPMTVIRNIESKDVLPKIFSLL